jgi:putative acetyltransferase
VAVIRTEQAADRAAVAAVTTAAFGRADEARMIEAIRASDGFVPALSLVAEHAGEVVGHAIVSYVGLEGSERRLLELGPIAVRPDVQGRGVGGELIRRALDLAEARGEPVVLVLGSPAYYARFGFRPDAELGIDPPAGIPEHAFMAAPLAAYDGTLRGRVVFPAQFV